MKLSALATSLCLIGLMVLGLTLSASATTVPLAPSETYTKPVHADLLGYVNYSWTVTPSSVSVSFVVTDPDGLTFIDQTTSDMDSSFIAYKSGTYTFKWTNTAASSVSLNYSIVSEPTGLGPVKNAIDALVLWLIVGAIVVVAVIVLIVFVVMKGSKKPQPPVMGPPTQYAPPGEVPAPYIPGMCPRCGNPIDSQHVFCPKCGHRVR